MEGKNSAQSFESREQPKPKVWVEWAGPGHEREYTVNFEGYGHSLNGSGENYIPEQFVQRLKALAEEGFDISNRGSRLEIYPPKDTKSFDAHFNVAGAMKACFGEEYKIEFVNMFKLEAETNLFE